MRAFAVLFLAASPAFAQGGGVYRVGGGVTAPVLLHKVEPEYSEEARRARYEGTVLLYVEVDPDGNAINIRVQRALGLGLDEKAIEAVRQWKFRPGAKDGRPVNVAANIEVNFRLLSRWQIARQEFPADNGVVKPVLAAHAFPPECKQDVSLTAALDIDSNGAVTAVRILRTTDSSLNEAAIDSLRVWRFTPAKWQGTPQPSSAEIDLACAR
jgi:TonB family protein